MKRLSFIFCLLIGGLLLPTVSALAVNGCCLKTNPNDPTVKPTAMNSSEEQCKAVATQTNNVLVGTFNKDQVADSNGCKEKPPTPTRATGDPVYFSPSVSIPGSEFTTGKSVLVEENTATLANYVIAIIKYAIGFVGIIAVIAFMAGGVLWLTAGGNNEQIGTAQTTIKSSIAGIILTLLSFLLLSMINTSLVSFKPVAISTVHRLDLSGSGCCMKFGKDGTRTSLTNTETECQQLKSSDENANGYALVNFLPGYMAEGNTCKSLQGCCKGIRQGDGGVAHVFMATEAQCKQAAASEWFPNQGIYTEQTGSNSYSSSCKEPPLGKLAGRTSCIAVLWQWGCQQDTDCCSGKCVKGLPAGNRCEP